MEARARRRYPRRWHVLQHANDQIEFSRTPALERDRRSRDNCQVSPCKCKFAQSRHRFRLWDSPTHKTNLGMRWIDLSRERNAGTIYDYRMAQMYEYCYIGSVDVPASQSNLHV